MWDGHTTSLFMKCKSSLWFKRTVFLTLWTLSFLILVIVAGNNELNTPYSVLGLAQFELPKNQIGAFSYTRYDPNANLRPVYSIDFSNLLSENNQLGIFKTALHKEVKIRDLRLGFYRYSCSTAELNLNKSRQTAACSLGNPCTDASADIFFISEVAVADLKSLIGIIKKFTNPSNGWHVNIDLGNVSEVLVNNFNYEIFYDGKLFLGIQSKRAIASYKQPGLLTLYSHVIVKTARGDTLEGNCIKWDIKNGCFTVDGIYILNRNGAETMGRDICVDAQLNQIRVQHVKAKQKEAEKCFAKLP